MIERGQFLKLTYLEWEWEEMCISRKAALGTVSLQLLMTQKYQQLYHLLMLYTG